MKTEKVSREQLIKIIKQVQQVFKKEDYGFGSHRYQFIYLIDYPTSTTQGHIHYIDGETGVVHFVETAF
ncbi:hypothetical protein CSE16_11460 [Solibacillus sp. R5-41]|uniref:hypothetical protein n=1 Tax=Solibacillus sp. R5-41 TaxID=2048654 RepID=UPI000C128AF4|nr:hypothetical protein [Solibacillus sp. R5-41]ATP40617.1 hypothetical protein CSE16_11460 [Solibacillus sp. R5-41]